MTSGTGQRSGLNLEEIVKKIKQNALTLPKGIDADEEEREAQGGQEEYLTTTDRFKISGVEKEIDAIPAEEVSALVSTLKGDLYVVNLTTKIIFKMSRTGIEKGDNNRWTLPYTMAKQAFGPKVYDGYA